MLFKPKRTALCPELHSQDQRWGRLGMGCGKSGGALVQSPWVSVSPLVKRGLDSWVLSGPVRACTLGRSMGHPSLVGLGPDLRDSRSSGDAAHPQPE